MFDKGSQMMDPIKGPAASSPGVSASCLHSARQTSQPFRFKAKEDGQDLEGSRGVETGGRSGGRCMVGPVPCSQSNTLNWMKTERCSLGTVEPILETNM